VIPKLRETMPIDRAKMRIKMHIPAHSAKSIKEKVEHCLSSIEEEHWQEGSLELVCFISYLKTGNVVLKNPFSKIGLIEPGVYRELEELIRKESKGKGQFELLSLKDVKEEEEVL